MIGGAAVLLDLLRRIGRAFGVGVFLVLIGVGGSLLALTAFPLIIATTADPQRRRRRIHRLMQLSLKSYCWGIHALGIAGLEFVGLERMRDVRGVLIVANHPSLLDVVLIMTMIPSVQCVVKAALWRNPFFRLTVSGAGYIRNDLEPEALVNACVATLRAGNNLIIFPEGTRSVAGQPMHLHRGFANIATLAEADLQPVTISCSQSFLERGRPWWQVPVARPCYRVAIGERLAVRQFLDVGPRPLAARRLTAHIHNYYVEELANGQFGIGPQDVDRDRLEAGGYLA
jgi:1-acyl-sn-glycerol-3-phosphate acyltransferase